MRASEFAAAGSLSTALGQFDAGVQWLESARRRPDHRALRSDPRYGQAVREVFDGLRNIRMSATIHHETLGRGLADQIITSVDELRPVLKQLRSNSQVASDEALRAAVLFRDDLRQSMRERLPIVGRPGYDIEKPAAFARDAQRYL